eukprot:UN09274
MTFNLMYYIIESRCHSNQYECPRNNEWRLTLFIVRSICCIERKTQATN